MKLPIIKNNVVGVILLAGRGKRLFPLTNIVPKCLLSIRGHTILEHQLQALNNQGVTQVIFCVGYKREYMIRIIKQMCQRYNITPRFVVNKKYHTTNTLFSLFLCVKKLQANVLLLNGDVMFDPNILALILQNRALEKAVLAVQKKKTNEEEIKFTLDKNHYIKHISKQIEIQKSCGEFTGIAYFPKTYVYRLSLTLQQLIREKKQNEYFEYALERTIQKNHLQYIPMNIKTLKFIEIDTYDDYKTAKKIF